MSNDLSGSGTSTDHRIERLDQVDVDRASPGDAEQVTLDAGGNDGFVQLDEQRACRRLGEDAINGSGTDAPTGVKLAPVAQFVHKDPVAAHLPIDLDIDQGGLESASATDGDRSIAPTPVAGLMKGITHDPVTEGDEVAERPRNPVGVVAEKPRDIRCLTHPRQCREGYRGHPRLGR